MRFKTLPYRQNRWTVVYDASLLKRQRVKRKLGFFALSLSLFGFFFFLSPNLVLEFKPPKEIQPKRPSIRSLKKQEFSIKIPKLEVEAQVKPQVDISNPEDYDHALRAGVAHAKGTALPGQSGTIYIFGHSTDYPWNIEYYHAFFYRLKDITPGEKIIINYKGKSFVYIVSEKKVVGAHYLEYLSSPSEENRLVLQTCWPPGTTWQRLIVVATPKKA